MPLGPPGAIEPSPLDPPGAIKPSPLEILAETFDRHNFKPSIGQALLVGYLLGRVAEHMIGNPERMREWAEFTISTMADTRKKAA